MAGDCHHDLAGGMPGRPYGPYGQRSDHTVMSLKKGATPYDHPYGRHSHTVHTLDSGYVIEPVHFGLWGNRIKDFAPRLAPIAKDFRFLIKYLWI